MKFKFTSKSYLIICTLFGWSGIQYFLIKDYKKGFLYLFTFGLCCIGWIIDIFKGIRWCYYGIQVSYYKNKTSIESKKIIKGYTTKKGKYVKPYLRKK